jgi:hypothetical protein
LLANVAAMSEKEAEMFRCYVVEGGILVSTGDTALYDQNGDRRNELALADVFGATYQGTTPTRNHFLRFADGKFVKNIDPKEYIICNSPGNIVETTSGKPFGSLHLSFHDPVPPYQTFSHHFTPPWRTVGPAVVVNTFGKGVSLYTPSRICAAYADLYSLPAQRKLLADLLTARAEPPLKIRAPLNVEVVANEQHRGIAGSGFDGSRGSLVTGKPFPSDRLVIHLIGYNPRKEIYTRGSQMDDSPIRPGPTMEEPLLYRAEIDLPFPPKSVRAWSPSTQIEAQGGTVKLLISEIHEALIVEL